VGRVEALLLVSDIEVAGEGLGGRWREGVAVVRCMDWDEDMRFPCA